MGTRRWARFAGFHITGIDGLGLCPGGAVRGRVSASASSDPKAGRRVHNRFA